MRIARHPLLTVLIWFATMASLGAAQAPPSPADVTTAVREYRVAHEQSIMQELVDLLAIPNIASDEPNIRRNAEQLRAMLERRGFRVQFFEIPKRGPIVFAELPAAGAARTVVFYAHYDGQPVDPKAWTGTGPFEPGLRTGSIEGGRDAAAVPGRRHAATRTTGGSTRGRRPTTSRPSSRCSRPSKRWPRRAFPAP